MPLCRAAHVETVVVVVVVGGGTWSKISNFFPSSPSKTTWQQMASKKTTGGALSGGNFKKKTNKTKENSTTRKQNQRRKRHPEMVVRNRWIRTRSITTSVIGNSSAFSSWKKNKPETISRRGTSRNGTVLHFYFSIENKVKRRTRKKTIMIMIHWLPFQTDDSRYICSIRCVM